MAKFNLVSEYFDHLVSGSNSGAAYFPEEVSWTKQGINGLIPEMGVTRVGYSGSFYEMIVDLRQVDPDIFRIGTFVHEKLMYGANETGLRDEKNALEMMFHTDNSGSLS